MEYKDLLAKMSNAEFDREMQKYFRGDAPKCEEEKAKDCTFYGQYFGECKALKRENCLGCSFYKKKGGES